MLERTQFDEVEEQSALYALGALPAEEAEKFRARLDAGCPLCSHLLAGYERVAVALAVSTPEMAPPERVRSRLLAGIGASPAPKSKRRGAIFVRAEQTPWQDTETPGVQSRELRGQNTVLLRMAPGSTFPPHQHDRAEECLVLEGSVESDGIAAFAGDYIFMPKGSRHGALYSQTGCTMLISYGM